MVKNILIYNFGIDYKYLFKNKENSLFGFSKVNYFIREYNNYAFNKILSDNKKKKEILKKKFEKKNINNENMNKYLKLIEEFQLGNYYLFNEIKNNNINNNKEMTKIVVYNSNIDLYSSIIKDYNKEKIMIKTQKNELNVFQNQEKEFSDNKTIDNQIDDINHKKECVIF